MSQIQLKPIIVMDVSFGIIGTSPLIQHNWSAPSRDYLRKSPAERRKQPKKKHDPEKEAAEACYMTEDGEYGLPLLGFKAALISAAHKDIGLEKTLLKKSFFVAQDGKLIAPLITDGYTVREDIVRIGANQTDLRYRPEFTDWRAIITAQVSSESLTPTDIANLVNRAGFSVGIGEWRPEKGGEYGRFRLDETVPFSTSEGYTL
jgi:hypothetical protein